MVHESTTKNIVEIMEDELTTKNRAQLWYLNQQQKIERD